MTHRVTSYFNSKCSKFQVPKAFLQPIFTGRISKYGSYCLFINMTSRFQMLLRHGSNHEACLQPGEQTISHRLACTFSLVQNFCNFSQIPIYLRTGCYNSILGEILFNSFKLRVIHTISMYKHNLHHNNSIWDQSHENPNLIILEINEFVGN